MLIGVDDCLLPLLSPCFASPPPFFPTLLRILLIIPSAKDGGGVIGETRRVQVSTFNSSVMLSRPELFFSFFKLALFLCGLHNGRCSAEKNPEGGTLITQIDSAATFPSPGTLSSPACAQVPHSHRSHRFLCHVNIIYHLENRLKPWQVRDGVRAAALRASNFTPV